MSINSKALDIGELRPRITIFGVGGAGCNAVNNMINVGLQGVEFVVANTDAQALAMMRAERILQIGVRATGGLGAGSQADVGRAAAEEVIDEIRSSSRRCAHGIRDCRHGRWYRHRRCPGGRTSGARARHPYHRRRHQAVPLRGPAPHEDRRGWDRRIAEERRHADHHSEPEPIPGSQREEPPSPTLSRWPIRCSIPVSPASPT